MAEPIPEDALDLFDTKLRIEVQSSLVGIALLVQDRREKDACITV